MKRMWRWVSRDQGTDLIDIWPSADRPVVRRWANGLIYFCSADVDGVDGWSVMCCAPEFRKLFGVCPKPGECSKVEFSPAKIVKEKK